MSDIDNEEVASTTNDTTEEVDNTEEVEGTDAQPATEDNVKYTESEMKSYARMKKAEAEARQLKKELEALKAPKPQVTKTEPSQKQDGLSSMDTIALIGAQVTVKEDIDEVVDYAKLKNISVAD